MTLGRAASRGALWVLAAMFMAGLFSGCDLFVDEWCAPGYDKDYHEHGVQYMCWGETRRKTTKCASGYVRDGPPTSGDGWRAYWCKYAGQ